MEECRCLGVNYCILLICRQVMTDENGKSKGFGFVSFEEHEAAQKVTYSDDSHLLLLDRHVCVCL